jgi:hypothetical protein
MIPQMVLGGAMFTFDKLNKDFTSVDKVPAIAEFMPSRYVYEGLIVHQFKHNNYKKNIFDIEQQESMADFKQVHYLPELREILNERMVHILDENDLSDKKHINDLELLRNELTKEQKRVPEIAFDHLADLSPDSFSVKVGNKADAYLNQLLDHYRSSFSEANALKDQFISINLNADPDRFNRIKDDHYNESMSSIVRREFEKNKIVRQGNSLVQMADPIYQVPEPENIWSFRTHFFAPVKHFAGKYFETLWFNIAMVWVLTILLYGALYFDLLKKALNYGSSIKWRKK